MKDPATLRHIALLIWTAFLLAGVVWLMLPGTGIGAAWTPHRTRDGWLMRRRVAGQIESRPATPAEADTAQAAVDYEWWATR